MLNWIRSLIPVSGAKPARADVQTRNSRLRPVEVQIAEPKPLNISPAIPIYPPLDGGIAIVDAAKIVASQSALIEQLRKHVAVSDDEFDQMYLAPIERLAGYVGLLPASRSSTHSAQGGLFRFALSMAFGCARAADGVYWSGDEPAEDRRKYREAWRYVAFLAGLCCELHRPLFEMSVFSEDGDQWDPYICGLDRWASQCGIDRIIVRWLPVRGHDPVGGRASTAFALQVIAGDAAMQRLHTVDPLIVRTLIGAVTDTISSLDDHPLVRLIKTVRAKVVEVDEANKPSLYGTVTQGSHLDPHVLDCMRGLVASKAWMVNEKGSRLHYGTDGLFLAWPIGGKEVLKEMARLGIKGIPKLEATLAEMLAASGVLATDASGSPFFFIKPLDSAVDRPQIMAVRFAREATLLGQAESYVRADWSMLKGAGPTPKPVAQQPIEVADKESPPKQQTDASPSTTNQGVKHQAPETSNPSAPTGDKSAAGEEIGMQSAVRTDQATSETVGSAEKSASGPAEIPEVPEASVDVNGIPPDIINSLGMPLSREIADWRDAWNRGQHPNDFAVVHGANGGLAVSTTFLMKSALPASRILEPLKANGFFAGEQKGTSARVTLVRKIAMGSKKEPILCYVLTRSLAARCGFVLDGRE